MMYPTDICMVGATGLVGHELLLLFSLLEQITTVKAVTRSPMGKIPPHTDNIILNFDKLKDHAEALKAQVYICCLGSTVKKAGSQEAFRKVDYDYVVNFAKVAEQNKAQKLIVISAMGANANSGVFYNRVKGEMEKSLRELNIPQIEIFRPSLILGDRKENRAGEDIAQRLSPYLNPLLVGPLKKYRAIKAVDIAKAMAIATLNFQPGFHVYESDQIQHIADQK
ncbi:NAD(P)H-binding protein [Bdellovibrio bacteriovorus]|uniref:NAD(P)H-binding protein n=1 Tax=Bdellovibrio TaxID=958 RepID=UPI0035A94102